MMAKQGAKTLVPRLRFPEFRNRNAWKAMQLAKALRFQVGFPFPSKGFNEEGLGIRLVRNRDLRSNDKPIYFSGTYSSEFLIRDGDILVGMDGDFTPCVWNNGEALLNQRVGRILAKDGADREFLLYFLTAHLKSIEESTARTTVKHLSHSDVEKICEPLPSDREQKKIADCLTSMDEVIAAQGRKVEALKAHKRGLMQQLFPREGETRPRLRFPEFRNAPEWAQTRLQSLARYENGKAYEQDIVDEGRLVVVNSRFVSTDGAIRKYTNADYCTAAKGDVLMVLSDLPNGRALAKCFLVDADGRYAVNQRVARLTPTNVNSAFLYYRLNRTPRLLLFDDGLTQTHLSKGEVQDCLLCVPSDQEEQQRVADCLFSLDTQIAAETHQLTALKTHKRGLMQQLFPVPEAG